MPLDDADLIKSVYARVVDALAKRDVGDLVGLLADDVELRSYATGGQLVVGRANVVAAIKANSLAEGENGELVVVNVFATDQDHLNFVQNMGGPMTAAGLTEPFAALEHLPVRKIDWDETRLR